MMTTATARKLEGLTKKEQLKIAFKVILKDMLLEFTHVDIDTRVLTASKTERKQVVLDTSISTLIKEVSIRTDLR